MEYWAKWAHKMGLPHLYLISAFLHDTPIPFQRYTVGSAFEREYRFGDGPDGRLIKIARDPRHRVSVLRAGRVLTAIVAV